MRLRPGVPAAVLALPLLASLGLAGCGASTPPQPPVPVERYVFISAKDCSESNKLPMQKCGDIIDAAVASHVANAPSYTSKKACEVAEGPERCERTDSRSFRPRLVAFLVSIAGPDASASVLYPAPGAEAGFRGQEKKQLFLITDETLTFSPKALAVYEANKGEGAPASSSGPF
jgi:uncharacterized protein YgiB involved in biofilm formation